MESVHFTLLFLHILLCGDQSTFSNKSLLNTVDLLPFLVGHSGEILEVASLRRERRGRQLSGHHLGAVTAKGASSAFVAGPGLESEWLHGND